MSDAKPKRPMPVAKPGHQDRPMDVAAVRAEIGIEPVVVPGKGSPTVTQKKTITQTSGDDRGLKQYIQAHGQKLVDELLALAFDKSTKDNIRAQVINNLLDRAYGKPTQITESLETIADVTSLHLDALLRRPK